MRSFIILIIAIAVLLTACSYSFQSESLADRTYSSETTEAGGFPLPDYFSSVNDLSNAIKSADFNKYKNINNLNYVYLLDKTPCQLPVSKIIVDYGCVGVYYSSSFVDQKLIEKYKDNHDTIQSLTSIKIITYRNIVATDNVPSIVLDNQDSFKSYDLNGQKFYAISVNADDGAIIGWEIFWVQDNQDICVGIPVNYGIEEALKYCSCIKHNLN